MARVPCEPDAFEKALGGSIAAVDDGEESAFQANGEEPLHEKLDRFAAIALAPVVGSQGKAEFGLRRIFARTVHGAVADERTAVSERDAELEPFAGLIGTATCDSIDRGAGIFLVPRGPALIAGYVWVRADASVRGRIGGTQLAKLDAPSA